MTFRRFLAFILFAVVVGFCLAVKPVHIPKNYLKLNYTTSSSTNTHAPRKFNVPFAVNPVCPADITVDADPGKCGAIVNFEDATAPSNQVAGESILLFDGKAVFGSPYLEKGMKLTGIGLSHIDAPQPIPCNNRSGALIHAATGNTWSYNGGEPFTPKTVFVCSTNMRFTTGDCSTEFTPTTTGDVDFPDTPEWQNITSMIWEETSGDEDTSIDNFRFIPTGIKQTAGLASGCFFPVGITPVIFEATDENGVVTACTFNVTVRDVEKPIVQVNELTTTLDASQLKEITIADVTQSMPTDNCGIDSILLSQTTFSCSDTGTNEITITVTDVNGNVSQENVKVNISGSTDTNDIDPIDDAIACEVFTLPAITGTGLSGNQQFFTQPNGMGTPYSPGQILTFADFSNYPITLYAYDDGNDKSCKPQSSFTLQIIQQALLTPVSPVEACESYVLPAITGTNLSGNQAYYTQSNGQGDEFQPGDVIDDSVAQSGTLTLFIFDGSVNNGCSTETSMSIDLQVCPLTASIQTSGSQVCDTDFTTITLTAVTDPVDAVGTYSYAWSKANDPAIISTSKTYNVLPAFTTTYQVIVKDDGLPTNLNTVTARTMITVNESPIVASPLIIELCGQMGGDINSQNIDLESYNAVASLDAPDRSVSYHLTQQSAISGSDAIDLTKDISIGETVIYVRVTDTTTGCFDTTSISFQLTPSPVIILEPSYVLCSSNIDNSIPTLLLDTDLSSLDYTFSWSLDQGNGIEPLTVDQGSIDADKAGVYTVTATDRLTGCSATFSTKVEFTAAPLEFTATANVSAVINSHSISTFLTPMVGDDSVFEVRLDDGVWYRMNRGSGGFSFVFEQVGTGNGVHTVFFRDASGCWADQVAVFLVGIPQFFTPNGDSYNDVWNVYGAANLLATAQLYIFDRYGKLLTQLEPNGGGWNGTFNGEPLPSTDYWYSLELADGEVLKGHFAMKR